MPANGLRLGFGRMARSARIAAVTSEHVTKLEGKAHRSGLYQCNECREQFTVTVKTVFERCKTPADQVACRAVPDDRQQERHVAPIRSIACLDISYKSTWFMMHRLREAMRTGGLEPLGGEGKIVEADETYYRQRRKRTRLRSARAVARTKRGKVSNNRPIARPCRARWLASAHSMLPSADKTTVDRDRAR